ncbi:hypothetical protein PG996_005251 [Apiospora saccharicola]|uniref:BTB domain-containing protein n=1 Tax=Apiospora saccharicola TaxID=335842 RepID=A0ABR1VL29_9PEZI
MANRCDITSHYFVKSDATAKHRYEQNSANTDYLRNLASRATDESDFDDGRGDVKLIAKRVVHGETVLQSFVASRTAMIRACKPWERMLAGSFGEAQFDHPRILDFTEDSFVALEIVMNVIHLRFGDVPQRLALANLAELAMLTDKYMLTAIMAPWVERWINYLQSTVDKRGNEVYWLWISWEFGLLDIFDRS